MLDLILTNYMNFQSLEVVCDTASRFNPFCARIDFRRAVSNATWCRIFREILCFSPLNLGTLLRCCVIGQGTSPSNASLDSGENEYLVGQRWQCVR